MTQSEIGQRQKLQTVLEAVHDLLRPHGWALRWNVDCECPGEGTRAACPLHLKTSSPCCSPRENPVLRMLGGQAHTAAMLAHSGSVFSLFQSWGLILRGPIGAVEAENPTPVTQSAGGAK